MVELGTATFASSVRSGRLDGRLTIDDKVPRLVVDLTLTVTGAGPGNPQPRDATTRLELLGPGDVVGIAPSEILRVFPNAGEHAAEPNYLASVEFDSPEMPWVVSLSTDPLRVTPWIALVVVPDRPGRVEDRPGSMLPWLVAERDELPPADESWAWAHAHAQGAASLDDPGPDDGRQTLSRLLCPTRLQPVTSYLAAVVPTYEAGVLAALRQNPSGAGDQRSWAGGRDTVSLPMYHHWRFSTGAAGDFEELARQLKPADASTIEKLGRLDLHLREDDLGALPPRDLAPVRTLLVSPAEDAARDAEHAELRGAVAEELGKAIEPDTDREPVVRPPKYGQWPAGDATVRDGPDWYAELNLQPHHRVVARVGADLIRAQQEELVAEAQRQLGDYQAARRARDLLRIGEMTATRLHARAIAEAADDRLVTTVRPALPALMKDASAPVAESMSTGGFGSALLSGSVARILRRAAVGTGQPAVAVRAQFVTGSMQGGLQDLHVAGPAPAVDLGRARTAFARAGILDQPVAGVRVDQLLALAPAAQQAQDDLVTQLRDHTIDIQRVPDQRVAEPEPEPEPGPVAEPEPDPGGLVGRLRPGQLHVRVARPEGEADAGLQLAPGLQHLRSGLRDVVAAQPELREHVAGGLAAFRVPVRLPADVVALRIENAARDRIGESVSAATVTLRRQAVEQGLPDAPAAIFDDLVVDRDTVDLAAAQPGADAPVIQLGARDVVRRSLGLDVLTPVLRDLLTADGRHEFDHVVGELASRQVTDALRYPPAPPRVTVAEVADQCRPHLQVSTTYADAVAARLAFAGPLPSTTDMDFVPTFDAPLVERLQRSLDQWILAGAERVPPNAITVVLTNPAFIEALVAGANHEIARELLWRDIPSDPRGTVFRRFWNTPLADPAKDLAPVHTWRAGLGRNLHADSPYLCVLVRSPLLRRYPNAVVQAAQGVFHDVPGGKNFEPTPNTFRRRLFQGAIAPDLTFSVLELTEDEVRQAARGEEWYLLLGEPVTEPKFGLDDSRDPAAPLQTWRNLAWSDLGPGLALRTGAGPDVPAREGVTWGANAAAMARILHQDPFRLVLPAAEFIRTGG